MKILVLNGSPKGKYSITLQTVLYLQKLNPEHQFEILHVGQKIKSYERDFTAAGESLQKAEVILFAYPVYTFLVPSQLHRFLELMKQSGLDFTGKYVSQITTSKHFYDMTAHAFIRENVQEMGMKFIEGLSADMDDLLQEEGRQQAREFFRYLLWSIQNEQYAAAPKPRPAYHPVPATVPECTKEKQGNVVIVADLPDENIQLKAMINRFRAVMPYKTTVVNLQEFPFRGGCLGCFKCTVSGKCVYQDGFDSFLRERIYSARGIVYAFSVQDHSMGYRFKLFDDRQFCEGHRTVISGLPIGYLVSGDYAHEQNLQTVVDARVQVQGNFFAGVATDEEDTDGAIDRMALRLTYGLEHPYVPPKNFYGVGGMKIFRDLVWLMQGFMQADHRYYRDHHMYDFPQKHRGRMAGMYLVGAMMKSPGMVKKMGNRMNEGILMPYKKVLEKVK